jgi:hypothetical protein
MYVMLCPVTWKEGPSYGHLVWCDLAAMYAQLMQNPKAPMPWNVGLMHAPRR